jgi:hypothetical protein
MTEKRGPLDDGAVSEQERAWMEYDAHVRRAVYVAPRPERTGWGRVLESIVGASRPNNWR